MPDLNASASPPLRIRFRRCSSLVLSSCAAPSAGIASRTTTPCWRIGAADGEPRAGRLTPAKATRPRVLLVAEDGHAGRAVLRILRGARIDVEWAKNIAQLTSRVSRCDLRPPEVAFVDLELPDGAGEQAVSIVQGGFSRAAVVGLGHDLTGERAARLLSLGVPSLNKPVSPLVLAALALRLSSEAGPRAPEPEAASVATTAATPEPSVSTHLETALKSYAVSRVLSRQQKVVLRLYLGGKNDKEIASACQCSGATVYEHWRRMARKIGGRYKTDVIADFHRFLAGN